MGRTRTHRHEPNEAPGRAEAADRADHGADGPPTLRRAAAHDALLLTPDEAAGVLRIGRTTVFALMKAGSLRPVHIGRSCRIPRAELERYVEHLQAPARPSGGRDRRWRPEASGHGGLPDLSTAAPDAR